MTSVAVLCFVVFTSIDKLGLFAAVLAFLVGPSVGVYVVLRVRGHDGPLRTAAITAIISPFVMLITPWALWPLLIIAGAVAGAAARAITPGELARSAGQPQ